MASSHESWKCSVMAFGKGRKKIIQPFTSLFLLTMSLSVVIIITKIIFLITCTQITQVHHATH
jgi:hypothetical protein